MPDSVARRCRAKNKDDVRRLLYLWRHGVEDLDGGILPDRYYRILKPQNFQEMDKVIKKALGT